MRLLPQSGSQSDCREKTPCLSHRKEYQTSRITSEEVTSSQSLTVQHVVVGFFLNPGLAEYQKHVSLSCSTSSRLETRIVRRTGVVQSSASTKVGLLWRNRSGSEQKHVRTQVEFSPHRWYRVSVRGRHCQWIYQHFGVSSRLFNPFHCICMFGECVGFFALYTDMLHDSSWVCNKEVFVGLTETVTRTESH